MLSVCAAQSCLSEMLWHGQPLMSGPRSGSSAGPPCVRLGRPSRLGALSGPRVAGPGFLPPPGPPPSFRASPSVLVFGRASLGLWSALSCPCLCAAGRGVPAAQPGAGGPRSALGPGFGFAGGCCRHALAAKRRRAWNNRRQQKAPATAGAKKRKPRLPPGFFVCNNTLEFR